MKKTLFAIATFLVAAIGVSAQKVAPRAPQIPWGSEAEIIIVNDLAEQVSGSWTLTKAAQKWVYNDYRGAKGGTISQSSNNRLWYDIYNETTDTMVIVDANWGGYISPVNKAGSKNGFFKIRKDEIPHFFIKDATKVKVYLSGDASCKKDQVYGNARIILKDYSTNAVVQDITSEKNLSKDDYWDRSDMIALDLDKSKSYELIVMTGGGEKDLVLQAIKLYGSNEFTSTVPGGSDLGAYINAYLKENPGEVKFQLQEDAYYTMSESIVANNSIQILGAEGASATIDASKLNGPFVIMSKNPAMKPDSKRFYVLNEPIQIKNVNVTGLKKQFFFANGIKYIVPELVVDNAYVELNGSTEEVIDFFGGGVPLKLTLTNSTFYSKTLHKEPFFTALGGQIAIQAGANEQKFTIKNCNFVNIATGNGRFFNQRVRSQKWQIFEVQKNIFVNSGLRDNLLEGINGAIGSDYPTWAVDYNTFLWQEGDALVNAGDEETTGDDKEPAENTLTSLPGFADFAKGDFTVAEESKQAKYKTGDPRWLVPYFTAPVEIDANGDIAAQINAALETSEQPKSIFVKIGDGDFTIGQEVKTASPIVFYGTANGNIKVTKTLTLGGTIAIGNVNLDFSEMKDPFIKTFGNDYLTPVNNLYEVGVYLFQNLNVTGLQNSFIVTEGSKNLVEETMIDNCVIKMGDIKGNIPFSFKGGNAGVTKSFKINNSTIWAPKATTASLFSTQSATHPFKDAGLEENVFSIENSTIYNIAVGKNFYTQRGKGQKGMVYTLKNSLILDSGKDNFVTGMNEGQASANPTWNIDNNSFLKTVDGEITDIAEKQSTGDEAEPVKNSVVGVTEFADLANGDFTISPYSQQAKFKVGDPRWLVEYIPLVEVDYTALVSTAKDKWEGAGGTAGGVQTSLGVNTPLVELYSSASAGVKMQQKIAVPNGNYEVKVFATSHNARGEDGATLDGTAKDVAYVFANDSKTWLTASGVTPGFLDGEQTEPVTIKKVVVENDTLTIGLAVEKEKQTGWHTIQIYSLKRFMPLAEAYEITLAEVAELLDKPMSQAVYLELADASLAEQTEENYPVLIEAVNKAKVSIKSTETLNALLNGEATIADDKLDNWTCTTGNAFHINTWSVEGNEGNDPTGMVTPFIEDWRNKNEGGLGNGQIVYSLPYVDPIDFKVSALVRLYSEAGNDISGATFFAGDKKVDMVAKGTPFEYNGAKGIYGTFTAKGSVGEDGVLRFGVDVQDATFNWVAIKNVKFVQTGDIIVKKWNFTKWGDTTVANLKADAAASKTTGWSDVEKAGDAAAGADPTEASKDNCFWLQGTVDENGELTANGVVIPETKGLKFNADYAAKRSLAIAVNYPKALSEYDGGQYLWLGGGGSKQTFPCFTIPEVPAGAIVTMEIESHKLSDARGVQLYAGEYAAEKQIGEAAKPTTKQTFSWEIKDATDVVVWNTSGCHIYSITIVLPEQFEDPGTLMVQEDWSKETSFPFYTGMGTPAGASYEAKDGKLIVTNTVKQNDPWGLQLFGLDWFNLKKGANYVVRVWANVPVDGQIQVNMGTWSGADQKLVDVKATKGKFKPIDVEFNNYPYETSNYDAHVLWQQGWLVGTVEISKIEVFEVDEDELIVNGYCEGTDGTSLITKNGEDGGAYCFNPKENMGLGNSRKSTCVAVHVAPGAAQDWDAQFFIYEPSHAFQAGEKYRISFWIKADKAAAVDIQTHTTPGNYIGWYVDGNPGVNATTEWQEVVIEGTITDHPDWGAAMTGMQTLAFNLSKDKENENTFYFDNISWKLIPADAAATRTVTGIEAVEEKPVVEDGVMYNLRGQRITAPVKGQIYIKNGKKHIAK